MDTWKAWGGGPFALFRIPEKNSFLFHYKLRREVYTWLEQSNAHVRVSFSILRSEDSPYFVWGNVTT